MAEKRKRDTPTGPPSDAASNPEPKRKRTKQNPGASNRTYTSADIRNFEYGISKIKDWTSKAVIPKHVQVIHWFDVEHLSKEECVKRYPNKQGKPCSMTNIFKVYNSYAPRFYAEKGLGYIPLGKRGSARAVKQKKKEKTKGKSVKKVKRSPLDIRLKELFAALPSHASLPPASQEDIEPSPCQHHTNPNNPEDSDATEDAITFLCNTGSTTHGDPSGLQIPRSSILRHCSTIREFLLENTHIDTVTHGLEISADTVCRFAACITGFPGPRLPDFVTTAYGTFEQDWSMAELEDLYVLAVTLGAGVVCDLIVDRLVEDLRRPQPRLVIDEFGEARYFDTLDIGPELLNFLWLNDKKGFTFFANVLFSHGSKGYARMAETHLANWHEGVKKVLIQTMKDRNVIDLFSATPSTLRTFHHSPEDFPRRLPSKPPQPNPKTASAPPASLRPTLHTARPRLEAFDPPKQTASEATLHLPIPRFPLTHLKRPQTPSMDDDPIYQRAAYGLDRLRVHKTAHMDERLRYRNEDFNAHHDTEEACRVKLAMCREKAALFAGRGIGVSEEDVEAAIVVQEKAVEEAAKEEKAGEGGGESSGEDEDESEEE